MKIKIKLPKKAHGVRSSPAHIVTSNDDLLTEILIRLPVKSLIRFQLVSKHWQSIITSREFILLRNPPFSPAIGFLFPDLDFGYGPNPLFEYIPFSVKELSNPPFRRLNFGESPPLTAILDSCNGLLLCCSDGTVNFDGVIRYYVVNPCTRRYSSLPQFQGVDEDSCISMKSMCLVFDPTISPHYKVVIVWGTRIYEEPEHFEFQFEVYSSESGHWKFCYKPFRGATNFYHAVYWNGAINWFDFYDESLYFNLEDEVLEKMPAPPLPDGWDQTSQSRKLYFGESCGHLHYVGIFWPQLQFNVYEMKRDYSKWFFKYKVDLSPVIAANPEIIWHRPDRRHPYYYLCEILTLIRGEKDEDSFLVLHIPGKAIRYNVVDKNFEVVYEFMGDRDREYLKFEAMYGYQYIESLCSI